ncbi:MAG: S-layer homology domain-containing protein [Candidatus Marinimicrobia bacterium]|nr:S-layer homology domain-containing protein [Candidatus Neomarinimicrobiota bacterium]
MKKLTVAALVVPTLLFIAGCGPKATSQSDVDSPEYHYKAGMRYLESEDYESAIRSFQRSVDLDKKFALGWGGLGLAYGLTGDLKTGRKHMDTAVGRGKKNPDVRVLAGRLWIAHKDDSKRWLKRAVDEFDTALKRKNGHEPAIFWKGMAYLYNYDFSLAEAEFRTLVERKGEYAGRADEMWALSQKIVRAQPGTSAGKKIALKSKISRADMTVLFIEELNLTELFKRFMPPSASGGFQTPAQMMSQGNAPLPGDVRGSWAEGWIEEAMKLGVVEADPDGNFYPAESVTRAGYARAVARILTMVTRDQTLETRYFGENPSRFSDVSSSHFAYPAMALCSERGIMKADLVTGGFNPAGSVGGADALLIIRTVQTSLRVTF